MIQYIVHTLPTRAIVKGCIMDMQIKLDILKDNLLTIERCHQEVESILNQAECSIRFKIEQAKNLDFDQSKDLIHELFLIQEQIAFIVFQFNYQVSDFLYNFIRDFDRCDEYAARHVFEKYMA